MTASDKQIKKLRRLLQMENTLEKAALQAGISENTARKYRGDQPLPSEKPFQRQYSTRKSPFGDVWEEITDLLENNSGLEAKTIFEWLQGKYPAKYMDGQLRTFQRKVREWRTTKGPDKEIFFTQVHKPGRLAQSDFTHADELGVTLSGVPFPHLLYHFVLTFSNWEYLRICFSESFESLSEGFQSAVWKLGKVPSEHCTDRLSAAVNNLSDPKEFTKRYSALMGHYKVKGRKIGAAKPNENGDVEQSHYRFLKALDQALMLRGSRDFFSVNEYKKFIDSFMDQRNQGRVQRLKEEYECMKALPAKRIDAFKKYRVRVGQGSTIRVDKNVYSVHSRLRDEHVEVIVRAEWLEVFHGKALMHSLPRLRGKKHSRIDYRHVITWLVRKPGAFANYVYREAMFPSTLFRITYDILCEQLGEKKGSKEYLDILKLAADEGEDRVASLLWSLQESPCTLTSEAVKAGLSQPETTIPSWLETQVQEVSLDEYDCLIGCTGGKYND